jgi:adenylate kinase family enzyme
LLAAIEIFAALLGLLVMFIISDEDVVMLAAALLQLLDGTIPLESLAGQLPMLLPMQAGVVATSKPQRISVVGASGSGKTHLARTLSWRLGLPLHELDRVRVEVASGASPAEGFEQRADELAQEERWIIDGHYCSVRHVIWTKADMVVWLNYPLHLIARRLMSRYTRKFVPVRAPGAAGATKSSVREIGPPVSWKGRMRRVMRNLRERREYGELLRSPQYQGLQVVELRSHKMTLEWIDSLDRRGGDGPVSSI